MKAKTAIIAAISLATTALTQAFTIDFNDATPSNAAVLGQAEDEELQRTGALPGKEHDPAVVLDPGTDGRDLKSISFQNVHESGSAILGIIGMGAIVLRRHRQ